MKIFSRNKNKKHTVYNILGLKIKFRNKSHLEQSDEFIIEPKPSEPIKTIKCKICGEDSILYFKSPILADKYEAEYYSCHNCGFVQTQEPFWLQEAYETPVTNEDTGVLLRNEETKKTLAIVLYNIFRESGKFLDYGGGYGFLTRSMRDIGFNYYWYDKYCQNVTAIGFEGDLNQKYDAISSCETFEHFVNPLKEIERILKLTDTIIFTETLMPDIMPEPGKWWYYCTNHGQHVSFYRKQTLSFIAQKYRLNYYQIFNLHIFTNKNLEKLVSYMKKTSKSELYKSVCKNLKSKTVDDMNYIINKSRGV